MEAAALFARRISGRRGGEVTRQLRLAARRQPQLAPPAGSEQQHASGRRSLPARPARLAARGTGSERSPVQRTAVVHVRPLARRRKAALPLFWILERERAGAYSDVERRLRGHCLLSGHRFELVRPTVVLYVMM